MTEDFPQPVGSNEDPAAAEQGAGVISCEIHGQPRSHPCSRCGDYDCASCMTVAQGRGYCRSCTDQGHAADYLEDLRQKFWGKRDGWAWLMGIGALFSCLQVVGGVVALVSNPRIGGEGVALVAVALVMLVMQAGFFAGYPWARRLLVIVTVLMATVMLGSIAFVSMAAGGGLVTASPALFVILFYGLLIYSILQSQENKLFFKLDVTREELYKLHLRRSNKAASYALLCGVLGFLVVTIPISLILAVIGLRKADMSANPPIGGRGYAIWAIIICALYSAGAAAYFVAGS